jgi:uncharacterized protein YjiS (DUF1127 family)
MTGPIHQRVIAGAMVQPSSNFKGIAKVLRRVALKIDGWLEARARAAANRDALACMSDRELLDIGIDRSSITAVADGRWVRDCPW